MTRLFDKSTKDQQADSLAQYLPNGPLYEAKFIEGSNLRNLLMGLACELFRIEEMMGLISEDHDIENTTQFIDQWESAVGIPDDCLTGEGTLEDRRQQVLLKFANMNAQTKGDFLRIAEVLGFTDIQIIPLQDQAYPIYPVPFYPTKAPASRFTMIVRGENITTGFPPYDVPFPPSGGFQTLLQCVFDKISPSNTRILYTSD